MQDLLVINISPTVEVFKCWNKVTVDVRVIYGNVWVQCLCTSMCSLNRLSFLCQRGKLLKWSLITGWMKNMVPVVSQKSFWLLIFLTTEHFSTLHQFSEVWPREDSPVSGWNLHNGLVLHNRALTCSYGWHGKLCLWAMICGGVPESTQWCWEQKYTWFYCSIFFLNFLYCVKKRKNFFCVFMLNIEFIV